MATRVAQQRPTELSAQIQVVRELTRARICFFAVPNGGTRGRMEAVHLRQAGVQAGVPDIMIMDPPKVWPWIGVALEMKREGGSWADVSAEQRKWLGDLETRDFLSVVGYGAEDALLKLKELGYVVMVRDSAVRATATFKGEMEYENKKRRVAKPAREAS